MKMIETIEGVKVGDFDQGDLFREDELVIST